MTWLICRCDFKGRRRSVMGHGWTELFFLDEATALAAGHRPCFLCRREDAEHFRDCWTRAEGGPRPAARAIDGILHEERLDGRAKRLHVVGGNRRLPDGAMVAYEGSAWIVTGDRMRRWTTAGYEAPRQLSTAALLLTPPSTIAAIGAGYVPAMHPTAFAV